MVKSNQLVKLTFNNQINTYTTISVSHPVKKVIIKNAVFSSLVQGDHAFGLHSSLFEDLGVLIENELTTGSIYTSSSDIEIELDRPININGTFSFFLSNIVSFDPNVSAGYIYMMMEFSD